MTGGNYPETRNLINEIHGIYEPVSIIAKNMDGKWLPEESHIVPELLVCVPLDCILISKEYCGSNYPQQTNIILDRVCLYSHITSLHKQKVCSFSGSGRRRR